MQSKPQSCRAWQAWCCGCLLYSVACWAAVFDRCPYHYTYALLRPAFAQKVAFITDQHQRAFINFLQVHVDHLWARPLRRSKALEDIQAKVVDWSTGVRWNTYNKMLRERGACFKSKAKKYLGRVVNWNADICECIAPEVRFWTKAIQWWAANFAGDIDETTKNDETSHGLEGIRTKLTQYDPIPIEYVH